MIRKALCLLAGVGVVALVACGGDDEGGEKYPSVESFCEAQVKEICAGIAAPCAIADEKCKSTGKSFCVASASGKTYQAPAADACVSKTHDVFQQRTITPDQEKELADTCGRVFGGTKKVNEPCKATSECERNLVCGGTGFCGEKTDKSEGQPCNNPGDTCSKDTFCAGEGNKTCQKKKTMGEICGANTPCQDDLRCAGTCKPKVDPQNPCDVDSDCVATAPYCDPRLKKCLPKYSPGTQACRDFGG
jgi:hypothetical protein